MKELFDQHKGADGMVDRSEMANVLVTYYKKYVPFTWTTDPKKGFKSMEECLDTWVAKAKKDPKIKLLNAFNIKKGTR
jgi:hypothetical protein